ncbi:peptidyl-prolyl cis-trans isomerase FKBP2-like [Pectinophora gossypiella]|uniref:peptidyl-prolyl cis-trans isomerase FKBP2-like n=1 Tax=Pectinophora gossypiella TaxID=13191 RepID=UPI00214EF4C5|nr:peptidyl-prolyl cis-trans isomerase FKBP2-like [Pectinophora gossypiella]
MKTFIATICKILLFVLIVFSIIPYVLSKSDAVKKLQIGVKKRPDNCPIKSRKGDMLYMHYTGTLEDGTEFDSSIPRGNPLTFTLGSRQVIKGWDQGLLGMCEGEQRKLVIPPELAYGAKGSPPKIPAHATLIFHVELVKIKRNDEL